MPTPPKSVGNMRKHLTNAEKDARQAEESRLQRGKRVYLKAPAWLSPDAKRIFDRTKAQMRELGILDVLDADTLALYADAVSKYTAMVQAIEPGDLKAHAVAQAWSRVALSYAEKMGISPTARARLAKKRAEQQPADDLELLLDDVREYVNG